MVYIPVNQTGKYPHIKSSYTTTSQHFHDEPSNKEPKKNSTFAKLYDNSVFFMSKRLEQKTRSATENTLDLYPHPSTVTFSGRLPEHSYVGNGTFQLSNKMTYSYKPVKLVPYSALTYKSEYGDNFTKKNAYKGYNVLHTTR